MSTTPFEALGGLDGMRALVDAFYDRMEALPEAAGIRAMHPADPAGSREKLWMFLVGRFGGPQLYVERYGHPRLRARHLPFPIATAEAQAWMRCMDQALDAVVQDAALHAELRSFFAQTADFMRNREG